MPTESDEPDTSNGSLKGARVLVTGAGGFIGSHLCEHLVGAGCEVTAMTHYRGDGHPGNLQFVPADTMAKITVVPGDLTDTERTDRTVEGHDFVFHLGAMIAIPYSYVSPRSYLQTNLGGTLNILEACRRHGVTRLIHTSTSEVYGSALCTPISESHPLQAQSPYSASKIAADKLVESYVKSFELPAVTVRPFNTYGPRQSARAVIPTVISQALFSPSIRIGSLDPERDLTFVSDTAEGFLAAACSQDAPGGTFNLGVGKSISVRQIIETVQELLGTSKPVERDPNRIRPAQSEVTLLLSDNSAALKNLRWSPSISLKEGLRLTGEFIADNPGLFRTDQYSV